MERVKSFGRTLRGAGGIGGKDKKSGVGNRSGSVAVLSGGDDGGEGFVRKKSSRGVVRFPGGTVGGGEDDESGWAHEESGGAEEVGEIRRARGKGRMSVGEVRKWTEDQLVEYLRNDALELSEDERWAMARDWASFLQREQQGIAIAHRNDNNAKRLEAQRENTAALRRVCASETGALKLFDVSITVFLDDILPLDVIDSDEVLRKLRYEALLADAKLEATLHHRRENDRSAISGGGNDEEEDSVVAIKSLQQVLSACYSDPDGHREFVSRVRARVVLLESAHPHEPVVDDELIALAVSPWATHVLLAFDPRTSFAFTADLAFHAHAHPAAPRIASYASAFRSHASTTSQTLLLPLPPSSHGRFFARFSSNAPSATASRWGYRVTCVPIRASPSPPRP
mmetsp:Transcript_14740/g.31586  ORF Transcript_14740/g.31586 Transcript_14740/m.31586 type:complete len:398 (+) Transcript_14740:226-1419(+)